MTAPSVGDVEPLVLSLRRSLKTQNESCRLRVASEKRRGPSEAAIRTFNFCDRLTSHGSGKGRLARTGAVRIVAGGRDFSTPGPIGA
jgi:hypothetical protein